MMNERESNQMAAPIANALGSRSHVRTLVLMAATIGGLYLCYILTLPFLSSLVWAMTLAVVFTPLHRWFERKIWFPSLAAFVSVGIVALIVVIPATFVGQRLAHEAGKGAELIKTKVESGEWRHALEAHAQLTPLADWMERQKLPETVKTVATWMGTTGAPFIKGSLIELIGVLMTFYLLFFFFRDRREALRLIRSLSPLSDADINMLFARVGDTIYATVYGTLAVSAMQGLMCGLMFWFVGLPTPLLWGVVMALLSIVPVLGSFVVWIPAALMLLMDGSWGKAIVLAVWCGGIVGTADNVLRPILVGKKLKLHTIIAFISVIGGIILFGPVGLVLGPIVLTITQVLLEIWHNRSVVEVKAQSGTEELP